MLPAISKSPTSMLSHPRAPTATPDVVVLRELGLRRRGTRIRNCIPVSTTSNTKPQAGKLLNFDG